MWRFVLKWSAATAIGVLFGFVFFVPVNAFTDGPTHKGIAGTIVGLGIGIGQWLVMRRHLSKPWWWIVATVVGFGLAGAAMGVGTTEELAKRGLTSESVGFVLGGAAGVAQWIVLRRRSPRAAWWIPANAGAFGLGWFVMWRLDFDLYSDDILPTVVNFALLVIPFVLISGITLWWILNTTAHREE